MQSKDASPPGTSTKAAVPGIRESTPPRLFLETLDGVSTLTAFASVHDATIVERRRARERRPRANCEALADDLVLTREPLTQSLQQLFRTRPSAEREGPIGGADVESDNFAVSE
jgi:hypothetical protein